jgi:hypothetical protein
MHSLDKKGVGFSLEQLAEILLVLAGLLVISLIIVGLFTGFNTQKMKTYGCWVGNAMMSSNEVFRLSLPVPCKNEVIDKPMSKADFSIYLTDVWFMYGKGNWDFHTKGDDTIDVSAFKLSEEIKVRDLFLHLLSHKGTTDYAKDGILTTEEMIKSDYQYIQKGSEGQTLCFHEALISTIENQAVLRKDQIYRLYLWDDVSGFISSRDVGDKIIISPVAIDNKDSNQLNKVGCCTLRQGTCIKLTSEKWYDYDKVLGEVLFQGEGWRTPGTATTSTGSLFK